MRFRIVLYITIFLKIVSFSEKISENIKKILVWGGGKIDITIFYVKTIADNTIETINGFARTINSKNY